MDPLSIAASVIALVQAVNGATKAVKYVASLRNSSLEIYRLQNELHLVEGYLYCLSPIIEAYKDHSKPVAELNTTHLEVSVSDLQNELKNLDMFLKGFNCATSQSASRRVTRAISWRNQRGQLICLCDSLQSKRVNLAHAVGLLQSSIGLSQSSMLLLMRDETASGLAKLSTQVTEASRRPDTQESTIIDVSHVEPVESNSGEKRGGNTTAGNEEEPTDQDPQRPFNVVTNLSFGCGPNCKCRCHTKSNLGTPQFLSAVAGRIVVNITGITVRLRSACSHPTCTRLRSSVRVTLAFPNWIVKRAICAQLFWNSGLNSGASLHLKVRRTIPFGDGVWTSIENHDLNGLQRMLLQRTIFPTDIEEGHGQGLLQFAIRMARKPSSTPGAIWEIISLLMELDPEVNREDYIGRSPIGEIALMLSLPDRPCELDGLARRAISLGGDEFHDCNTIIHDAIFGRSQLSLQESLNIEPKSIDKLDAAGLSPLHWAVHRNNVTAVEILLTWKAPVDLVTRGERRTALHIAARSGNVVLSKMLLDAGAKINYRDIYQRTALCLAALSGAADLVHLLLFQGADVHAQETDGITVIQRAIEPDTHPKDEQAIELIIEKLAQFGADLNCEGRSGETPIMTAIRYNSPAAFRELVSRGARVEKKDGKGWTVLHYAAYFANTSMIQALEKVNMSIVDPDSHDHAGKTAETILDEKLEEGGNGETATAAVSFREMIATVKLEYSKQMRRESTKQYQSEDDSGTDTYEDCSDYYQ